MKNANGNQLISQQADASKWAVAAAAAKAFLDKYVPGMYDLYKETDGSGNIDPYLSCRNVMYTDWNKEWIFAKANADPAQDNMKELLIIACHMKILISHLSAGKGKFYL